MQDKFHDAATEGNIELIKQYSKEPGFNVDVSNSQGYRAIHLAARSGKLDALKYLIETHHADITDIPSKRSLLLCGFYSGQLEVCRYILSFKLSPTAADLFLIYTLSRSTADFKQLENAIREKRGIDDLIFNGETIAQSIFDPSEIDWKDNIDLIFQLFPLLLQNGADLHGRHNGLIYKAKDTKRYNARIIFAETMIRADLNGYLRLFESMRPSSPTVEEIVDQLGGRRIKIPNLAKIKSMLIYLEKKNKFNSDLAKQILNKLETMCDLSIDPADECPKYLKNFIAKKTSTKISLEDLIFQLQHARKIIPSPYNQQQLQMHQDINHIVALQHHINYPEHYTIENLKAFVHPDNHLQALLEMKFYPDIADWICIAALHPDLNGEEKINCILLLQNMESPTELQKAILSVGEISYNSVQTIANEVNELNTKVDSLEEKVSKISLQLQNTEKQLSLLISLISPQNTAANGKKEKFETGTELPKSNFFSNSN